MASSLSGDLLLEILLRLPVKSLLRFRCVCKSWNFLISNPSFISYHIKKNDHDNIIKHVVVLQDDPSRKLTWKLCKDNDALDVITTIDFPFGKITNKSFVIKGCINGLICLLENVVTQPVTLILWNPMIRKHLILPSPYFDDNPMNAFSIYGFGFAPCSKDYKLIRIMHYHIDLLFEPRFVGPFAEVFSLSKGSWHSLEAPLAMPWTDQQVYSNDSIHWLAFHKQNVILAFDFDSEIFNEMELPKDLKGARLSTLELENWVGLMSIFEVPSCLGDISMWVMKDYGVSTSWTKHLVIRSLGIMRSVVGVRRNGKILLNSKEEENLVLYDPKTDQLEELKIKASKKFQVASYLESLILLDNKRANGY